MAHENESGAHIVVHDTDFMTEEKPQARTDAEVQEVRSLKPKDTIPMRLPTMSKEHVFSTEMSPEQNKWWQHYEQWQKDFMKSAEAALRAKLPNTEILVKDFRSLMGEKDEYGFDLGYDENDFEIEFQCGRRGDKVGEGDATIEHWRVRRVLQEDL